MKRVLLRAPLLTNSGYGVHSRQVFEWLNNRNDIDLTVECLNWGQTPWIVNGDNHNGLIGEIMKCSVTLDPPYDIAIQVQLPDEWDQKLGKKNIGISAFVEIDKCNTAWIDKCNEMDHVIVPSTFTKNVIMRSGIPSTPVSVVPEWFNHDILDEKESLQIIKNDERYDFDTDFNILIIGQITSTKPEDDRKNLMNTIVWLCQAFEGEEDVGIVIKANMGKGTILDRKLTAQALEKIVKSVRKKSSPKVYLIHGNMSSKEIAALYNHDKIKCFVSATRGEGYGLPLIDSAAAGVPIVATNYSGHLEFLDAKYFYPVDYKSVKINDSKVDNRIFFKGCRWAEPDRNSFISNVLEVKRNLEKAKTKSGIMAERIKNNYHKVQISKLYDNILNNL